ncbi:MAG: hypothetical protein SOW32_03030 [Agathobacter sp.]|nr:hypothetical protein [Agathobacter sp.]
MEKLKKCIYAIVLTLFLITGLPTTYAKNIEFDVTVGGSGSQDPLSKRTIKSDDGDNNAYYRPTRVSNSYSYIMVESINLYKQAIRTPQLTELCSYNIGRTLTRWYNVTAPGGEYYYMNATTNGPRIRVRGYYCP